LSLRRIPSYLAPTVTTIGTQAFACAPLCCRRSLVSESQRAAFVSMLPKPRGRNAPSNPSCATAPSCNRPGLSLSVVALPSLPMSHRLAYHACMCSRPKRAVILYLEYTPTTLLDARELVSNPSPCACANEDRQ
jgi:hypothetical protein